MQHLSVSAVLRCYFKQCAYELGFAQQCMARNWILLVTKTTKLIIMNWYKFLQAEIIEK